MKRALIPILVVVALAVLMLTSGQARADIITFGTTAIDRLDLAGPQVEGSFTYEAIVGEGWEIVDNYSNPGYSLKTRWNRENPVVGDTVEFVRTDGGWFTFDSVDFATVLSSNSDQVLFSGFLGSTIVGTLALDFSTSSPSAYQTVLSGFSDAIDRLTLEVTFHMNEAGGNGASIDNVVLTPTVPEPSTVSLWLLACVSTVGFGWYRKRKN
jgi:hypothetical protein